MQTTVFAIADFEKTCKTQRSAAIGSSSKSRVGRRFTNNSLPFFWTMALNEFPEKVTKIFCSRPIIIMVSIKSGPGP